MLNAVKSSFKVIIILCVVSSFLVVPTFAWGGRSRTYYPYSSYRTFTYPQEWYWPTQEPEETQTTPTETYLPPQEPEEPETTTEDPQVTEEPTQYVLQTNLVADLKTWELHPYDLNYVAFEADGSVRLDPTSSADRATWAIRCPVTPGQRVIARAEIKTEAISPDYIPPLPWCNGGRIGIDFYSGGRVVRAIELSGIDGYGPWIGGGWVEWGSDWSLRELDNEDTVVRAGEEYAIMWIQAMAHDAPASAWFRNMEFYILN